MSTRALVGRTNADGSVDYTSINFDGYLAHVGMLLVEKWNTDEAISELLAGGKISSLGSELGEKHDGSKFPCDPGHENYTIFYHRDRNQPLDETRAQKADTVDALLASDKAAPFVYLFRDGEWTVKTKEATDFVKVNDASNAALATVELLSESPNDYILNVDLDENPGDFHKNDKAPTFGEIVEFLNYNADGLWEFVIDKEHDVRIRLKSDSAMIALKLRFNIGDHAERLEAAVS